MWRQRVIQRVHLIIPKSCGDQNLHRAANTVSKAAKAAGPTAVSFTLTRARVVVSGDALALRSMPALQLDPDMEAGAKDAAVGDVECELMLLPPKQQDLRECEQQDLLKLVPPPGWVPTTCASRLCSNQVLGREQTA